jgi:hypothetical protein
MAKLSTLRAAGGRACAIPEPSADNISNASLGGACRGVIWGLQVDRGSGNREISVQYDGHFALIFARWLNGYFHVLAQGCEEIEKPANREVASAIAGEC